MLRSYLIRALIKGEMKPREGIVTVSNIENVKTAFKLYGHLMLNAIQVETDVNAVAKKLSNYTEV